MICKLLSVMPDARYARCFAKKFLYVIIAIMGKKEENNTKPASKSFVQMEQLVLPNDANALNTLFGGRLLQWIDAAGAMAATKHSRREVVTVAVDSVDFREPIKVGNMVKLIAKVTWTGRTSMEVKIDIFKETPYSGEIIKTNQAFMTFVALDGSGKPAEVPVLLAETEEEIFDNLQAKERRKLRLKKK